MVLRPQFVHRLLHGVFLIHLLNPNASYILWTLNSQLSKDVKGNPQSYRNWHCLLLRDWNCWLLVWTQSNRSNRSLETNTSRPRKRLSNFDSCACCYLSVDCSLPSECESNEIGLLFSDQEERLVLRQRKLFVRVCCHVNHKCRFYCVPQHQGCYLNPGRTHRYPAGVLPSTYYSSLTQRQEVVRMGKPESSPVLWLVDLYGVWKCDCYPLWGYLWQYDYA